MGGSNDQPIDTVPAGSAATVLAGSAATVLAGSATDVPAGSIATVLDGSPANVPARSAATVTAVTGLAVSSTLLKYASSKKCMKDPSQMDYDKPPKPSDGDKHLNEIGRYHGDVKAAEADLYKASDGLHLDNDHDPVVRQVAAEAVHFKAASDCEHDQAHAKTSPLVGTGPCGTAPVVTSSGACPAKLMNWSERSACAALGCWHKRRWPLFCIFWSERRCADGV